MSSSTLANQISIVAIGCASGAVLAVLYDYPTLSVSLAILAFVGDLIDGPIARAHGGGSKDGAVLDATTDILLYVTLPLFILSQHSIGYYAHAVIVAASAVAIFRIIRFSVRGPIYVGDVPAYTGIPVVILPPLAALTLFLFTSNFPGFIYATLILWSIAAVSMVSKITVPKTRIVSLFGALLVILAFVTLGIYG